MKQFSELGIAPAEDTFFTGEKIKIKKVLNKKIIVLAFKIEKSKIFDGKSDCLYLQIEVEGEKHVIFTSGKKLIRSMLMAKPDDLPFCTTIIEKNEWLEFT